MPLFGGICLGLLLEDLARTTQESKEAKDERAKSTNNRKTIESTFLKTPK
jgi:hypothetical protein